MCFAYKSMAKSEAKKMCEAEATLLMNKAKKAASKNVGQNMAVGKARYLYHDAKVKAAYCSKLK